MKLHKIQKEVLKANSKKKAKKKRGWSVDLTCSRNERIKSMSCCAS